MENGLAVVLWLVVFIIIPIISLLLIAAIFKICQYSKASLAQLENIHQLLKLMHKDFRNHSAKVVEYLYSTHECVAAIKEAMSGDQTES